MCHNIQYYAFWVLSVKGTTVEMYPEEVVLSSWPVVFNFSHSFDTAPNLNNSEVVHVHAMRAQAGIKAELHSFLTLAVWSVLHPICFTPHEKSPHYPLNRWLAGWFLLLVWMLCSRGKSVNPCGN